MWGRALFFILVSVISARAQEDPCKPNPCGDNTRCSSQVRDFGKPVISCSCLNGFDVPKGGDPFDGCVEAEKQVSRARPSSPVREDLTTTTTARPFSGLTTRAPSGVAVPNSRPSNAVPKSIDTSLRAGQNTVEEAESRRQAGKRPTFLLPKRNEAKGVVRPSEIKDVDTPELFPDECLVHEDCEGGFYCELDKTCTDACSLDVCGEGSLCTAKLHRPVCSCPDGYEGNPYDKCIKSPSRVGMKFRRR